VDDTKAAEAAGDAVAEKIAEKALTKEQKPANATAPEAPKTHQDKGRFFYWTAEWLVKQLPWFSFLCRK
jgi:hypothetical protein